MRRLVLGLLLAALVLPATASGQATRTFVSGVGNDADPCSRTAPCRTFAGAMNKTFIGGEIDVLDPCGCGTLNITKSITIDGNGTYASALASGTTGFIVNIAPNANDPKRQVVLRNLSVNGAGASGAVGTNTGTNGVRITGNGAKSVRIQNAHIFNFSQNGILVEPTASSTRVTINDSTIADNFQDAVRVQAADGAEQVDHRVTIRNSQLTGNSLAGINVPTTSGPDTVRVFAERNQISDSGVQGIAVDGAQARVTVTENFITGNNLFGLHPVNSGQIISFGDNKVAGHTTDGPPTSVVNPS